MNAGYGARRLLTYTGYHQCNEPNSLLDPVFLEVSAVGLPIVPN